VVFLHIEKEALELLRRILVTHVLDLPNASSRRESDSRTSCELIEIDSRVLPARSSADTSSIPFASISNVTSICGTARGAGLMFAKLNDPRR
jgi:hypothetical protein